jgi:hypothetical protein
MPGQRQMMMAQQQPQRRNFSPADFNRLARLYRHQGDSIAFNAGVNNQQVNLANVGYQFRIQTFCDLTTSTTIAAPTGKWLSGAFGAVTARFPAPLGLVQSYKYALNVGSPVLHADGYGLYILDLIQSRGMNKWIQNPTLDKGRSRKERDIFAIFNSTTGGFDVPDQTLTGASVYKLRLALTAHLTFGETAVAGLIPVQDSRVQPQLFFDWGTIANVVQTTADLGATPAITGNFDNFVDYFVVPNPSVVPDTRFVKQTKFGIQTVSGTGEQIVKPTIGGVILKNVFTVWNAGQAIDTTTIDSMRLRVQQGLTLENISRKVRINDERRWYSKELPDEVYAYDHVSSSFGDPGVPGFRDRLETGQLTLAEYILNWNSGTAVSSGVPPLSGPAEIRWYVEQLVRLETIMAAA